MGASLDIRAALLREYRAELWRRRLVWPLLEEYLDRDQLADTRAFFEGCDVQRAQLPRASWYDDISRQRGKSFKWCTVAVVWAHCHPGQFIKYAAQLGVSVRGIVAPTINKLLQDMPADMRPSEDKVDHVWRFHKSGGQEPSEIKAAGVNLGHYDDLRGPKSHLVIEDECAFYDEFDKVQEVVGPQLQTTGGVKVFATTPPYSPTHPVERVCNALKAEGRYSHRTIYNHPRMSTEDIQRHLTKEAVELGLSLAQFKATAYYRREYLCMHVVETSRSVVPEWSAVAGPEWPEGTTWGDAHTKELPRPLFYDTYDALDIGFTRDPSAWLGGYWDWDNARLVVEAETPPLFRKRAEELAEAILGQRRMLWPTSGPRPTPESVRSPCGTYWLPYLSVGDAGGHGAERLTELSKEGLDFMHASKADLESMVQAMRTLVAQGKVWIHPRCAALRRQLASGLWADTAKTDFERDSTSGEHLDHVAALMYLVRHVDRQRCPVPLGYGRDTFNTVAIAPKVQSATMRAMDDALSNALGGVEWGGQ